MAIPVHHLKKKKTSCLLTLDSPWHSSNDHSWCMLLLHYFNIYPKLVICSSPESLCMLIYCLWSYFLSRIGFSTLSQPLPSLLYYLFHQSQTHPVSKEFLIHFIEYALLNIPQTLFHTSSEVYPMCFIFYLLWSFLIWTPYGKLFECNYYFNPCLLIFVYWA